MEISLAALFIQGIPEQIGVITLAFVLARAELKVKQLCLFGSALALSAFLIRMLPITFGLHTIVLICLLVFFVANYSNANLSIAIISALSSFIFLMVFEVSTHLLAFNVFKLPMEEVLNNQSLMILLGMPQVVLLYLSSFIIRKYRKRA